jgi:hypothetical protein
MDSLAILSMWDPGILTYFLSLLPFIFVGLSLKDWNASKLPTINNKRRFEFSDQRVKQSFVLNARKLLRQGLEKFGGKPFRMLTDHGPTIILSPEYAEEIRNIPELNHVQAIAKVNFRILIMTLFRLA